MTCLKWLHWKAIKIKNAFLVERPIRWRMGETNLMSKGASSFKTWTYHKYNSCERSDLLSQMVASKARSSQQGGSLSLLSSFLLFYICSVYIDDCIRETQDSTVIFFFAFSPGADSPLDQTRFLFKFCLWNMYIWVLTGNYWCWLSSESTSDASESWADTLNCVDKGKKEYF